MSVAYTQSADQGRCFLENEIVSVGPALNVTGMSIELLSVVLGGLALPQAKPIRSWMRDRLANRVVQWLYRYLWFVWVFIFVSTYAAHRYYAAVSTHRMPSEIRDYIVAFLSVMVPIILFFCVLGLFKWLSQAGDETLRNVLLLMGTLFGMGIALQLVSAIIG